MLKWRLYQMALIHISYQFFMFQGPALTGQRFSFRILISRSEIGPELINIRHAVFSQAVATFGVIQSYAVRISLRTKICANRQNHTKHRFNHVRNTL